MKAKGQAFIVFSSAEEAEIALDSLQGFEIFERPMNVQYAKTRSDATVQKEEGEAGLEQHKKQRIAEKERKQAIEAAEAQAKPAKRAAAESLAERPAKTTKPGPGGANQDEYLPPNKILLLRELPEDYGKEALTAVFQRFPGFKEVRVVPGRKGLAFAEYEDETGAIAAREAMNGVTLGEKNIRVTFQRQ
ncbi:U1 small nuclear ribonucleoprotein [Fulvia fulva]|uniref:U1 small nuclear ribonucleoprotein n=1 Tax=Passalora fulva TaxID=5499 RepID=A0A9Q8US91_PASFU|nr:U1 small nuclear ribonucleoprotein [Fulvia fulva]KAK4617876.1 U1 small nuclear ribonucleoprotein [Fulvia fulva]KAK4618784.1 U1 small nuclear ribonucleoprotein [Fulvia fulva]UJO20604.1 U1 small nuclear ribonucleoprotein [Fulvia fulva]WPV18237.1 U1 small nuclear ribonucleoprotein [Fulvia fulva]WPV33565.1 U1 small nuclear ribonucleoprotein [Fulvia fulva]